MWEAESCYVEGAIYIDVPPIKKRGKWARKE